MEITCGPFKFTSNFDSGNLGSVELIRGDKPDGSFSSGIGVDYEVNVWTKSDCFGTQYSNGNRTWFYFGIKGGKPNAVLKLNILNLNKQQKLFEQGMQPVFCYVPQKPKWERVKDRVVVLTDIVKEASCGISFRQKLPAETRNSTMFLAFTYPFSYANLTSWLDDIDSVYVYSPMSDNQLIPASDIYYCRETVCLSFDGRPVDLLTITSTDGMLSEREPYLHNLFPRRDQQRCHKFASSKKIVFLSSRVHPGEVPAQFVMNGVIKFLLEENDPRARALRRLFVFKLIPMLNPDGVYRGHYRTDPSGVNLNRVYLKPSPVLHPTIYAARKLILYAHLGQDSPDDYEFEERQSTVEGGVAPEKSELKAVERNENENQANTNVGGSESENRLCAGCIDPPANSGLESENVSHDKDDPLLHKNNEENLPILQQGPSRRDDEDHQCTFESCDEDSVVDYQEVSKNLPQEIGCSSRGVSPSSSSASGCSIHTPHPIYPKIVTPSLRRLSHSRSLTSNRGQGSTLDPTTSKRSHGYSILKSSEVESGLFVYMDFHAHATKRGIFMYGNHFDDIDVQTECMLLPRLMALNSQHFDFSACNFTEKLMTVRDRRDGASREGSGRVAVSKLTGLIRSYTLECNYNTGRLVNHLIQRPGYGQPDPVPHSIHHPPKFTPELLEGVGRSLCESILDLTELNPWPRLKSTEFRTLDGLRNFLRRRLTPTYDLSLRSSSSVVPGSSKSSLPPQYGNAPRGKSCSIIPKSPSLLQRRSLGKIFSTPSTSGVASSSGPLIPKKENQALLSQRQVASGSKSSTHAKPSKTSLEKPSTSSMLGKGKQRPKLTMSCSVPTCTALYQDSLGLLPSSSTLGGSRSSLTQLHKPPKTKNKKKLNKGKNNKKQKNA